MAVFAAIAFATLFLENYHFLAFDEGGLHFADYFGAFNGGGTDFYFTVGVKQQNAVEFDGLAFLNVAEVVYIQELAGFGFELLSLDFYNCVHCMCVKTKKLARRAAAAKIAVALVVKPGAEKMRTKLHIFNHIAKRSSGRSGVMTD